MKKLILASVATLLSVFLFSQEDSLFTNKKGMVVVPEKGDIALGFGANTAINFFGNLFNGNQYNQFALGFIEDNVIYGKYFLEHDKALRIKLRLGMGNRNYSNLVPTDNNNSNVTVEDNLKQKSTNINLGAGLEKRKGKTRLVGFFGGEVFLMYNKLSEEYTYGNLFTYDNPYPISTVDFETGMYTNVSSRPLERTVDSQFGIGIRAFIGVEYFILPKISVGAEFGWSIVGLFAGESKTITQTWDYNEGTVVTITTGTDKENSFNMDTDNFDGVLYFMFHF